MKKSASPHVFSHKVRVQDICVCGLEDIIVRKCVISMYL